MIVITYGAKRHPNGNGFLPVVHRDGRPRWGWRKAGLDLEDAIVLAREEAEGEASRYSRDFRARVVRAKELFNAEESRG